jgi:hypothetical protein
MPSPPLTVLILSFLIELAVDSPAGFRPFITKLLSDFLMSFVLFYGFKMTLLFYVRSLGLTTFLVLVGFY